MKLDSFYITNLLNDRKYEAAIDYVAQHFGIEQNAWRSIPLEKGISAGMYAPDSMRIIYPYGITMLQPGYYWGWHSVYGWENWISTSTHYRIKIRLPEYTED